MTNNKSTFDRQWVEVLFLNSGLSYTDLDGKHLFRPDWYTMVARVALPEIKILEDVWTLYRTLPPPDALRPMQEGDIALLCRRYTRTRSCLTKAYMFCPATEQKVGQIVKTPLYDRDEPVYQSTPGGVLTVPLTARIPSSTFKYRKS